MADNDHERERHRERQHDRDPQGEHHIRLPEMERLGPGHEESDINAWAVGKFGIGLVFLCIVAVGLLFGLMHYFLTQSTSHPAPAPGLSDNAANLPPSPRLQTGPVLDLKEMQAAEDQILNGYGWIDAQHGVVRIPINRAMDLLAQRGLPARTTTAPQSAASNVTVPTESGLGPKMIPPGGPLASGMGPGE